MSEKAIENKTLCACGHSIEEHKTGGCHHRNGWAGGSLCDCIVAIEDLAQQAEAEVLALRQQLAEAQAAGEVKRPMPTRKQIEKIIEEKAVCTDSWGNEMEIRNIDDAADAIMALFTDSAGGGQ